MFKFLGIFKIWYKIQIIDSKNLLTNKKKAKKVTWSIYRPDEKSLKCTEKIKKISNINLSSVFECVRKKIVEFIDLTHTFYWLAKTDKKDNLDNLSTYVSTKYILNNVGVSWHFQNVMHNI